MAFLIVSCGSIGRTAEADEATNTQQSPSSSAQAVAEGPGTPLLDLNDPGQVASWTTINDPVMGGLSTSKVSFGNGGLVFSGSISLENNGGFASARSPQDPRSDDGGGRQVASRAGRGDGKTYLLRVGTAGQPWSYVQRFSTEAAVERIYDLPVADFRAVGMRLDPAPGAPQTLDPAGISQISLYILDKQQGPFELTVSAVGAAA